MARRPRYFIEGQPHHVTLRGNNRTPIFASEADYLYFLTCLEEIFPKHGVAIHALALMSNHIHLLVTPTTPQSLPKAMQSLGCRYVRHFNHVRRRTGTLWEGRYRSTLVHSARYLLACMCYIERNPERAGIVRHPEDYRWSSCGANAIGSDIGVILTPHQVYLELGRTEAARETAYRKLLSRPLPQRELEAIRHATNRTGVLGRDGPAAADAGVVPGYDPGGLPTG